MKKIVKYQEGEIVPADAIFISSVIQTEEEVTFSSQDYSSTYMQKCFIVWHYFLLNNED